MCRLVIRGILSVLNKKVGKQHHTTKPDFVFVFDEKLREKCAYKQGMAKSINPIGLNFGGSIFSSSSTFLLLTKVYIPLLVYEIYNMLNMAFLFSQLVLPFNQSLDF